MEFKFPRSIYEEHELGELEEMIDLIEKGVSVLEEVSFSRGFVPEGKSPLTENQVEMCKRILEAQSCIGMYLGYSRAVKRFSKEDFNKIDETYSKLFKRLVIVGVREKIHYNPHEKDEVIQVKQEWNEYLKRH